MNRFRSLLAWAAVLAVSLSLSFSAQAQAVPPLSLHPQNPHYFLFRGRPTVLVTSGEHSGAVLNPDFDYVRYLDALRTDGLNLTRLFSGTYVEPQGAFHILNNTLAPAPVRFLCPWARSSTPGYANGGAKFDLMQWDEAYFHRLKDFVTQAGRCGVVVELDLFCPYYEDAQWHLSPLNPANNVKGTPDVARTEVLTMKHPELVALEDKLVRKIVEELAGFDNLYFEICNEPYFGGVTPDWQAHIADTIRAAEPNASLRHLISLNIANGSAKVEQPNPAVSLLNFHYAHPPDAVAANFGLQRAIGCNETGFEGVHDHPYRTEGWDFLLAGGALYNNLDYSFTAAHPDGTAAVEDPTPGGGGPALRKSLGALKRFMESFDFIRMKPDTHSLKSGVPTGATARVLSEPGKAYAVYVKGGAQASLTFTLPAGRYQAEWIDPRTGAAEKQERFNHAGGEHEIASPSYSEDIALNLRGLGPVPTRAVVSYGPHPHQLLDVHLPPGDGPFPVVLWFGGLWSPDALLHRGAPPVYFENNWGLTQPEGVEVTDYLVHSPRWGLGFQKLAEAKGITCYVKFPGHPTEKYADMWEFLLRELGAGK